MVVPDLLARALRALGTASAILALAGCAATPREAQTPTLDPVARGPVSRIEPVAPADLPPVPRAGQFTSADIVSVAQLPDVLLAPWRRSQLPDGALSLVVAEVGQTPMIAINPAVPRNPASVMKLVTTYAALEGLGPAHTWRTEMLTAANALPRPDGTLPGPLYLRATGDPNIEVRDLWAMMRDLRLRGIQTLPGIVIDRSVFGNVAIDPNAFDNAGDRVYNASPDALVLGYGAVRLWYTPDPATRGWRAHLDPPVPGVRIDNQVKASAAACPGAPAVRTQQVPEAGGLTLRVTGTVALSCGDFSVYRLALSQPQHAAGVLQAMWQELGGRLTGPVLEGRAPAGAVVLAAHESPPLSEAIRHVNKSSNNIMARMLLLALAREYGRGPATAQAGAAAVNEVFAGLGLRFPELVIDNGSGLSRISQVSAASLAAMLNTAWASPRMPEFLSSMAIAGGDGTVRRRWGNGDSRGRAHLKTGTLRDVSALAGYVQGRSGRRYVIVSMVNDARAHNVRAFNDQLVEWLSAR